MSEMKVICALISLTFTEISLSKHVTNYTVHYVGALKAKLNNFAYRMSWNSLNQWRLYKKCLHANAYIKKYNDWEQMCNILEEMWRVKIAETAFMERCREMCKVTQCVKPQWGMYTVYKLRQCVKSWWCMYACTSWDNVWSLDEVC